MCHTEVRALYACLSRCVANLPTQWAGLARRGSWTPCSWAQRAVHAQWGFLNGRACRLGPFSTVGERQLRAFVHYRSSPIARRAIVACYTLKVVARVTTTFKSVLLVTSCTVTIAISHCKRCISYSNSVRPSVRHTPVLCQNDGT